MACPGNGLIRAVLKNRRLPMSLNGRISELAAKHRHLDEQIAAEQKRPSSDDLTVKDLKRQKLKIKEQLRQLKAS